MVDGATTNQVVKVNSQVIIFVNVYEQIKTNKNFKAENLLMRGFDTICFPI